MNPRLCLSLQETGDIVMALNQHTAMDPKVIGFTGYPLAPSGMSLISKFYLFIFSISIQYSKLRFKLISNVYSYSIIFLLSIPNKRWRRHLKFLCTKRRLVIQSKLVSATIRWTEYAYTCNINWEKLFSLTKIVTKLSIY